MPTQRIAQMLTGQAFTARLGRAGGPSVFGTNLGATLSANDRHQIDRSWPQVVEIITTTFGSGGGGLNQTGVALVATLVAACMAPEDSPRQLAVYNYAYARVYQAAFGNEPPG